MMISNVLGGPGVMPRQRLNGVSQSGRFGGSQTTDEIALVTSKGTFDQIISTSPVPVLVKFEKKDCPACVAIEPTVKQVAKDNTGKLKVVRAWMWDPDNPDNRTMKRLAGQYKITTVPVFILFNQGKVISQGEGASGLTRIINEQGLLSTAYPEHLPKPYQPAGAKLTVLFDGECTICRRAAEKLKFLDKKDQLALVPLQAPSVREKYPHLKLTDLRKTIHVVANDGSVYTGAYGFREIGKIIKPRTAMGYLLKAFTLFSKMPGILPLSDKIYLAFSKRRFMFEAQKENCPNCSLEESQERN